VQFESGAVLQNSRTPSLRVAGFEDDDEDENEAPGGQWRLKTCQTKRLLAPGSFLFAICYSWSASHLFIS